MTKLCQFISRTLLLLLTLTSLSVYAGKSLDITNSSIVESFVDGAVKPMMAKEHSPSGVVVVMKDDQIVLAKGYGYQDVEKLTPINPATSMFRIASISKLFTWFSVMQLVDQGKLDLDTDVNKYLTQFQIKDTFPGQPITLRHIMTHTAGFEDASVNFIYVIDQNKVLPLAESLKRYQPERVFAPGTRVAYSNYASSLAGLIVQDVSGVPYNQYVTEHFFKPLGMQHTTIEEPLPASFNDDLVKGYKFQQGLYVEQPFELTANLGPSAAVTTSALDMMKLAKMILHGGQYQGKQYLKASTIDQMLTEGFVQDPRLRGMGLGFLKREYGYKGFNNFGHDGALTQFFSHFGLSRKENVVLFSVFTGAKGGLAVHDAFVKSFYDEFYPKADSHPQPPADFAERGQQYVGNYIVSRANYSTLESIMRGLGSTSVSLMPDNTLLIGKNRFIEIGTDLFKQKYGDMVLAFERDKQGKVKGFVFDGIGVLEFIPAKFYETQSYMIMVVAISLLVMLGVLIRWPIQRQRYLQDVIARKACFANMLVSVSHLLFFMLFAASFLNGIEALIYQIPLILKIALVFPILACFATLYQMYTLVQVYQQNALAGRWARLKHVLVTLLSLWLFSFYYTWHLLGYQYMS